MTVAYRSNSNTTYGARTSTSLSAPAGLTDDDIMLAGVFAGASGSSPGATAPVGWFEHPLSPVNTNAGGFFGKFHVFWKRADNETGAYVFNNVGGASLSTQGLILAYSGVKTEGVPFEVSSVNQGTGTTSTSLAIFPTFINEMIVALGHNWAASATLSPPTGMTERFDSLVYAADVIQPATGTTNNKVQTVNGNGSSDPWAQFLIGLIPEIPLNGPVQVKTGTSTLATTTIAFDAAPTPGNRLFLAITAEDINATPNTGWIQNAEMEQVTFHAGMLWERVADGSNSFQYTINSASASCWILAEFPNLEPVICDASEGQFQQSSSAGYTSAAITPTAGDRLIVAAFGGTGGSSLTGPYTVWTNHFKTVAQVAPASPNISMGMAYRWVKADGVTSYSTGVQYPSTVSAKTALMAAFKKKDNKQYSIGGPLGATFVAETDTRQYANLTGYVNETTLAPPASPNVSVNVTGPGLTAAAGTVTVDTPSGTVNVSVDVTSPSMTGSVGDVSAVGQSTIQTTGPGLTTSAGTLIVIGKANVDVAGPGLIAATGGATVSAKANVQVTGETATGATGTVTVATQNKYNVTGPGLTASAGTVTVNTTSNVSVNVTGPGLTVSTSTPIFVQGQGVSVNVTGPGLTASTAAPAIETDAIINVTGVGAIGLTAGPSVEAGGSVSTMLMGLRATTAVGDVSIVGKANVDVTGPGLTASAGTVTVATQTKVSVTGVSATGQAGNVTISTAGNTDVPVTGPGLTVSTSSPSVIGKAIIQVTGTAATALTSGVTVEPDINVSVTGPGLTAEAGTLIVLPYSNISVDGLGATTAVGDVEVRTSSNIFVSVTGEGLIVLPGDLSVGGGIAVNVTGSELMALTGSVDVRAEGSGFDIWNGTEWVDKPAKVWSGIEWQRKPVKTFTSEGWK